MNLKHEQLISIIIPTYNTPARYLSPLIYSIVSQTYMNWELILVDGSNDISAKKRIEACLKIDTRIRKVSVKNGGISANTNEGIKLATGEYIALVDHDDVLDETALFEVMKTINENPGVGVIYTDEDKISEDGSKYFSPHFKPDWSPDLLTNVNYITHLLVVKRSLANKVGLLDSSKDGAQDYDFMLRLSEAKPQILHIPKVLYHWREAMNSTATDFTNKPNVTRSAKIALEMHLSRSSVKAKVAIRYNKPGFYRITYSSPKSVSIIVTPFTANTAILKMFTEVLLLMTREKSVQVTIILPDSLENKYSSKILKKFNFKYVSNGENYLKSALEFAEDYTIIITQPVLPMKESWVGKITGPLQLDRISAVAPIILSGKDLIDDAGLVRQEGNLISLFHNALAQDNQTYLGNTDWDRNVNALSGAIVAVRSRELLEFISKTNPLEDIKKTIQSYTNAQDSSHRNNLILGSVNFDNYGIHLSEADGKSRHTYSNQNLLITGPAQMLTVSDSAAETVLGHLIEAQEDKERLQDV
jgi:glycosyltransferase involved in cell wall biosynthesis